MENIRGRRSARRRTCASVAAVLAAVAIPFAGVAEAAASAPGGTDSSALDVSARMTAAPEDLRPGGEVTVELTIVNTGSDAERVLIDEAIGDVLDDARLVGSPRSSAAAVLVTRLGHDRFALTGRLEPGEHVTVGYTVVVLTSAEQGDGVLRRVAAAVDEVPNCDVVVGDVESSGLGACTAIALPGAGAASASPRHDKTENGAPSGEGRSEASGAIVASGTESSASVALVESPLTIVLGAAAAVGVLAVAAIVALFRVRRARRAGHDHRDRDVLRPAAVIVEPARPARPLEPGVRVERARRPVTASRVERPIAPSVRIERRRRADPLPHVESGREARQARGMELVRRVESPEPTPRASAPRDSVPWAGPVEAGQASATTSTSIPATPALGSRRERREAEQRLAERGLALPVA